MEWRAGGVFLIALILGGCGGSSSGVDTAVGTLRDAVSSYNTAAPGNVAATGSACAGAAGKLRGKGVPAPTAVATTQRTEVRLLGAAYEEARRGFATCATAGRMNDYLLMARATDEIERANRLLAAARRSERRKR